jgi:membrane protein
VCPLKLSPIESPSLRKILAVLQGTIERLGKDEIGFRAAALAYYGLLSLFPLLLFLIFLGSQFLESGDARVALENSIMEILPAAVDTVLQIIHQTLEARGSIGIIGGIGLLWSASAFFNAITTSLNVIWGATPRPFWRRRLVAAISVLTLGVLFLLSVVLSALAAIQWPGRESAIWHGLNSSVGLGVTILLFWLLFHGIPNKSIDLRASLGGAIFSAVLWQGAKTFFAWYLASGLTNYGAVYGSLASVIALILWVYISALILFIGAELGASLQREVWLGKEQKKMDDQT